MKPVLKATGQARVTVGERVLAIELVEGVGNQQILVVVGEGKFQTLYRYHPLSGWYIEKQFEVGETNVEAS